MTGVILIILAAAALGTAFACYHRAFYSPVRSRPDIYNIPAGDQYQLYREEMISCIDALSALPFEQVSIRSRDGLRLTGRYYPVKDGAPVAVCFHGYRAAAVRDFCGGSLACMELGVNVLLVDQRAQGMSEGHTMSFGAKEKLDCLDWVNYCVDRFGPEVRVFLFGISMGAATVLLAAGLDLPGNVAAVIADSPYSSAEAILKKVCRDAGLPASAAYQFLRLGASVYGHFSIREADVMAALSAASVPVLIIHGEDDRFVPCEMSRQMKAAHPERLRLETFPGAGHGLSYMTDKERYTALVSEVLGSNFSTQ